MADKHALESCPLCGGGITTFRGTTEVTMGARRVAVQDSHERCDECGEGFYGPGQLERLEREAASRIRASEGLLTPDQIRAIRERLALSQAAFEQLLGVGPKTVVRWERGTVFQNRSTDALIRAVDAVPGVAPFLHTLRNNIDSATQPSTGIGNRPDSRRQRVLAIRTGMSSTNKTALKGGSPMATKQNVHTVKNSDGKGWVNKVAGEAVSKHQTQQKAIEKGRTIAKQAQSEHLIHGTDGKIRARNTYGKDPFPPRG